MCQRKEGQGDFLCSFPLQLLTGLWSVSVDACLLEGMCLPAGFVILCKSFPERSYSQ